MGWVEILGIAQRIVITAGGLGAAVFGVVRGAIAIKQILYARRQHQETGEWRFDSAVSTNKAQLDELRRIRTELTEQDTEPHENRSTPFRQDSPTTSEDPSSPT